MCAIVHFIVYEYVRIKSFIKEVMLWDSQSLMGASHTGPQYVIQNVRLYASDQLPNSWSKHKYSSKICPL